MYLQDVDIDAQVNSFSVDLSGVEFFDSTTQNQLNDFKDAVDINYDDYINEVVKHLLEHNDEHNGPQLLGIFIEINFNEWLRFSLFLYSWNRNQ